MEQFVDFWRGFDLLLSPLASLASIFVVYTTSKIKTEVHKALERKELHDFPKRYLGDLEAIKDILDTNPRELNFRLLQDTLINLSVNFPNLLTSEIKESINRITEETINYTIGNMPEKTFRQMRVDIVKIHYTLQKERYPNEPN